ncbi:hypothetical protein LPJ59_006163 [Coemansia sp. RSA 2399]|nr:hypothetical protein LPJ59_006163 [Coemansia sp. RSA 2399]
MLCPASAFEIRVFGRDADVNAVVVAVGVAAAKVLLGGGHQPQTKLLEIQLPPTPTADVAQEPIAGPDNFILPMVVLVSLTLIIVVADYITTAVAVAATRARAPAADADSDKKGWTLVGRGGKAVRPRQRRRHAGRQSAGIVAAALPVVAAVEPAAGPTDAAAAPPAVASEKQGLAK